MGHDLYNHDPAARAVFDQADEQLGFSLSTLCFDGPLETLTETVNQQPALFVTSVATWQAMQSQGWRLPDFIAGHSLGELSALVVAGSLSFADGLDLVQQRGRLMARAGQELPGAMAAILALDIETVHQICQQASDTVGQSVQVANDNCPGQVVISGHDTALTEAMRLAEAARARKVVKLPISIAAHSALMQPAAEAFAQAVAATPIATPRVPVIGNVSARPLTSPEDVRTELTQQLTAAVSWTQSMTYLLAQGVDTFVEVGPGKVLLSLIKRMDRKAKRIKFENEADDS